MNLALAGVGAVVLQAAAFAPAALAPAAFAQNEPRDLPYAEIARRWLERTALTGPSLDWRALVQQRFARLELGAFDVYVPATALADARPLRDVAAAVRALLDAETRWIQWVAGSPPSLRKERDSSEELVADWLRSWSPKTLGGKSKGDAGGRDLAEGVEGPVGAALAALRADARAGRALGADHELAGIPIVVFPRRGEFVEFVCVTGSLDPREKSFAWASGVATWMEYNAAGMRFVTLQYGGSAADYEHGPLVGERNPAALGELVAQVGTRALLASVFSGGLDPALSSGMANALVIDLYGELDTRIDGDVRARVTQGSSTFVPGGNPEGGTLPPTSAENRWRGTKGKDHFVGVLAQVQEQTGKRGSSRAEKLGRFELRSDDGSVRELVSAPFLGPGSKPASRAVLPDYLELARCYGVAFLHWLRMEGAEKPQESEARFAELLRGLARGSAEGLPQLFQEVYGMPLSATATEGLFEQPTLEGRFLAWLSKQG